MGAPVWNEIKNWGKKKAMIKKKGLAEAKPYNITSLMFVF
jgi:hypothetical protein